MFSFRIPHQNLRATDIGYTCNILQVLLNTNITKVLQTPCTLNDSSEFGETECFRLSVTHLRSGIVENKKKLMSKFYTAVTFKVKVSHKGTSLNVFYSLHEIFKPLKCKFYFPVSWQLLPCSVHLHISLHFLHLQHLLTTDYGKNGPNTVALTDIYPSRKIFSTNWAVTPIWSVRFPPGLGKKGLNEHYKGNYLKLVDYSHVGSLWTIQKGLMTTGHPSKSTPIDAFRFSNETEKGF